MYCDLMVEEGCGVDTTKDTKSLALKGVLKTTKRLMSGDAFARME
jgi:hypothetical protein